MEEDIMILESECYYLEELGYLRENNHFIRFNQALKNLIKGYRELEEYYKEQNEVNAKFIPVSLVEETIEELNRKIKYEDNEKVIIYLHKQRKTLQELLEKRKYE